VVEGELLLVEKGAVADGGVLVEGRAVIDVRSARGGGGQGCR